LQLNLKELELSQEADRQLRSRLETLTEKLVAENADLSSALSETRQKLESEVRVRENRDARLLLDTQELSVARERERELKQDISRIQTDLERERNRMRNLTEKVISTIMSNKGLLNLELLITHYNLKQKLLLGCNEYNHQTSTARGHFLPIKTFQNARRKLLKTYFNIRPLITGKFPQIFLFLIQTLPTKTFGLQYLHD
jgi:hypothetical protein